VVIWWCPFDNPCWVTLQAETRSNRKYLSPSYRKIS
jgi:hypothetical protein